MVFSAILFPSLDFHSARKDLTFALRSISAHAHGCGVPRSIALGTPSTDLM
jgi:hypothetical protein